MDFLIQSFKKKWILLHPQEKTPNPDLMKFFESRVLMDSVHAVLTSFNFNHFWALNS